MVFFKVMVAGAVITFAWRHHAARRRQRRTDEALAKVVRQAGERKAAQAVEDMYASDYLHSQIARQIQQDAAAAAEQSRLATLL